jgi:putative acetyltransferase
MEEAKVLIRGATPDDARGILEAHRAAVFGTARVAYPAEIVEAWAAVIDPDSVRQLADRIATGAELAVVADAAGEISGFGSIAPETSELLALYVRPDFGGRGIGRQLLAGLEELARRHHIRKLSLDASLNAESFYMRCGYAVIGKGEHVLRTGVKMACIKMSKALSLQ